MASNSTYYVPENSHWPIIAAFGIMMTLMGAALWVNQVAYSATMTLVGLGVIFYLFFGWFRDVITESMSGKYNVDVDLSFRHGMVWFITSEAFFFITFFGVLFYVRSIAIPYLGGEGQLGASSLLWEGFNAAWPLLQLPDASQYTVAKAAMGPGGIPAINTAILLTSGVTITWAHWALKRGQRQQLVWGLLSTSFLGVVFIILQAYEYGYAYSALDLTLNSGVYGSIFYMLTGFHGLHVTIGSIMLIIISIRCMKGHFTISQHFGFEAVAWYWHFVDVVWLVLYVFVYWL